MPTITLAEYLDTIKVTNLIILKASSHCTWRHSIVTMLINLIYTLIIYITNSVAAVTVVL